MRESDLRCGELSIHGDVGLREGDWRGLGSEFGEVEMRGQHVRLFGE